MMLLDIVLTIADHPSRELLAQFRIPVGYLRPFHPYHLELVQVCVLTHRDLCYCFK